MISLHYSKELLRIVPKSSGLVRGRFISTSIVCCEKEGRWRERNNLPINPNSFGPLSNLPDYTFMDGRPTPIGTNQKRRLERQREVAQKVVQMCKELDFAKERYAKLQKEKEAEREKIITNKLKPKGYRLLRDGTK